MPKKNTETKTTETPKVAKVKTKADKHAARVARMNARRDGLFDKYQIEINGTVLTYKGSVVYRADSRRGALKAAHGLIRRLKNPKLWAEREAARNIARAKRREAAAAAQDAQTTAA